MGIPLFGYTKHVSEIHDESKHVVTGKSSALKFTARGYGKVFDYVEQRDPRNG